MNQKVIYSTLLSPAKTLVEKEVGEEGGRCCTRLHPHPGEPFWSCKRGGVFKTGIRRKWTFVPQRVTHNIDGITLLAAWLTGSRQLVKASLVDYFNLYCVWLSLPKTSELQSKVEHSGRVTWKACFAILDLCSYLNNNAWRPSISQIIPLIPLI